MGKKPGIKLHTFQIGSPRKRGEGPRIGTVRFLPRGVKKKDYAKFDYFDVWLPSVAPSRKLIRWIDSKAVTKERWALFLKRYENELTKTDSRQTIQLLAKIATRTPISIGCYCPDENRCHRSKLRQLIERAV
jgi:uncharacterized protein YeaO (DUF488 family)